MKVNYNKWVKTSEALPSLELLKEEIGKGCVDDHYASCFIFIGGVIEQRPFNFRDNCWDDRDFDDFEYEANQPTHWMLDYPYPERPSDI